MATAQDVINRALAKIGVRAAESPLTAAETQDGLDALNDMLAAWENSGVTLGFLPVEKVSDTIRVPRHSLAAIKANLALIIAPEYGRVVNPALAVEARDSLNDLMISLSDIGDVNYPSTLPVGSGNECNDLGDTQRFFPDDQEVNF